MNPLDWTGPQFLLSYVVVGGVALYWLAGIRAWDGAGPAEQRLLDRLKHGFVRFRRSGEAPEPPKGAVSDPYLIAYLRGRHNEALRVATVSLVDRGLLHVEGTVVSARDPGAAELARRPIEKALLRKFETPAEAASVFGDVGLEAVCRAEYEQRLKEFKLIPDDALRAAAWQRLAVAVAALWGLALLKIVVALGRGRTNVGFLVVLALVFAWLAYRVAMPKRTARGEAFLADLRTLFESLRERAAALRPGGSTGELALLAAVFGLGAVPLETFPYTRELYPRAASSWAWGSSCGASCGTSCGSSCGGGCGSGCGGGCGGCGS